MTRRAHLFGWYASYLALAALITYPLVLDLSGALIGHETGDAYEMAHHIWWFRHALQTGEPLFYQTLMAYPDGLQGISLWANPLQFFPAWALAFVMPVPAAYNLTILLTMALNGWAMAFLVGWLLRDEPPRVRDAGAWLAGVAFMAHPVFQGHLFGGHAGLLVMWPVPLLIWALARLLESPSRGRFAAAVAFYLLSPAGHSLQVIYVLLPIMGMWTLGRALARDWRAVGWLVAVGAVGTGLLALFLLPVAADTFADDTYTGDAGYVAFSTDLLGLVTPSFGHVVFSGLEYPRRVLGVNLIEGYTYLGIVAGGLAGLALARRWRASRGWLALGALAWALALGPLLKLNDQPLTLSLDGYASYITLPWAWVYTLPGFSLARTPGRFTFALAVALAVLVGYGVAALWRARLFDHLPMLARRGALVGLAALMLFEYQAFFPFPTVTADVPPAIADLRDRDDVRAVMDMPWGNLLAAKDALYLKTWHHKPQIAGQVTRRTPVSPAKLTVLEQTLDPALLRTAGVDVVILHRRWASPGLARRLRQALGAPYYQDDRFALFNVPPTDAPPDTLRVVSGEGDPAPLYFHYHHDHHHGTPTPTDSVGVPAWALASGSLELRPRQQAWLMLDGVPLRRLAGDGRVSVDVPLPLTAPGYHTLALTLDPPCPRPISPALTCPTPDLSGVQLAPLAGDPLLSAPVRLADGIRLMGAVRLADDPAAPGTLSLALWWHFDTPRDPADVRFIAGVDPSGARVIGDDTPISAPAGTGFSERVTLRLPADTDPAALRLYVGWYRYPDLTRYPVLDDAPGAPDGWIALAPIAPPQPED